MRKASAFMAACLFSYGSANAQDVIVNHYEIAQNCHDFSMYYGVIKNANTMEGRALIANAEKLAGLNPNSRKIAIREISSYMSGTTQEFYPFIPSPTGYTICSAAPSFIYTSHIHPNFGTMGISTLGDTTFNSTIRRVIKDRNLNEDGLAMELLVPRPVSFDIRIQAGFDVVFVKATSGWKQKYKACLPTGSHPWLSRKNQTSQNVKCNPALENYCE